MKKILVADDEKDILNLLKEAFELEDYLVYTASNGAEVFDKVQENPDIILLDINMPDMDGYTVCEKIRDYVACPILFLTARIDEQDRVNGFKSGGDDYILKPFGVDELLARVAAHLRREERKMQKSHVYLNSELVVDFNGHRVLVNGEDIGLTKTEYQILELLITHTGQVFDKEQIYELVRGYDGEGDASIITEHVRRIRKKFARYSAIGYIETVWGVGYKWIG